MKKLATVVAIALAVALVWKACAPAKKKPAGGVLLRLATTTSVADSGLLKEILPAFEKKTGYRVEVQAVGSGKALELLAAGDADVAITHAPAAESAAVATGAAATRTPFMRNDFVIVGPKNQAAVIAGAGDIRDVLRAIAGSGKKFVSRGDDSGTHQRERQLWRDAGIAPSAPFIVSANAGMGAALALASKEHAFALSDRSTFLVRRRGLDLAILFQGDDELTNEYSVLEPGRASKKVNAAGAKALAAWLRSEEGRAAVGSYGINQVGESLFTPLE